MARAKIEYSYGSAERIAQDEENKIDRESKSFSLVFGIVGVVSGVGGLLFSGVKWLLFGAPLSSMMLYLPVAFGFAVWVVGLIVGMRLARSDSRNLRLIRIEMKLDELLKAREHDRQQR